MCHKDDASAGIEASPYFVAVGRDVAPRALREAGLEEGRVELRHGLAEDTRLPAASADVVTVCLVMHELPASATRALLAEASRCAQLLLASVPLLLSRQVH